MPRRAVACSPVSGSPFERGRDKLRIADAFEHELLVDEADGGLGIGPEISGDFPQVLAAPAAPETL